jgi:hypothetical protein
LTLAEFCAVRYHAEMGRNPQKDRALTRRQMGAMVLAPGSLLAQAPAANASGELEAAMKEVQREAEALRKFRVPMMVEPSFSFEP